MNVSFLLRLFKQPLTWFILLLSSFCLSSGIAISVLISTQLHLQTHEQQLQQLALQLPAQKDILSLHIKLLTLQSQPETLEHYETAFSHYQHLSTQLSQLSEHVSLENGEALHLVLKFEITQNQLLTQALLEKDYLQIHDTLEKTQQLFIQIQQKIRFELLFWAVLLVVSILCLIVLAILYLLRLKQHYIKTERHLIHQLQTPVRLLTRSTEQATQTPSLKPENATQTALLQHILDHLPLLIIWKDKHSIIRGYNHYLAQFFGLSAEMSLIGLTDADTPWKRYANYFKLADQKVIKENQAQEAYLQQLRLSNKSTIWLEFSRYPLHDAQGEVSGVLIFAKDMTQQLAQEIERQKTAKQLRQSRTRLAHAQRIAQLGYWEWSLEEKHIWYSSTLGQQFGLQYQTQHCSSQLFFERIIPADRLNLKKALHHLLRTGIPIEQEICVQVPQHAIRYLQVFAELHYNLLGEPETIIGTCQDLTTRKHGELAILESEQRFRLMADAAPVMIWLSELDTHYSYFNQRWLMFTGCSLDYEQGQGWTEHLHPDDYQHYITTYLTAFEHRRHFQLEYRLLRHDKVYRWFLTHGSPRFTPDGQFIGYIGSCIDITEQRQAVEALRESEARYRAVIEDQTDLLCRFLEDTTLIFVNEAFCHQFKIKREQVLGCSFLELFPNNQRLLTRQALLPLLQGKVASGRIVYENRITAQNGEEHWYQWFVRVIQHDQSKTVEFQAVGRDISALKQIELSLKQARQDAEQASHAKSAFLANMSHELRTPLNGILGYAQLLGKDSNLTQRQVQGLNIIKRSGEHLLNLINDVLDLSKVEAGKLEIHAEPFSLPELLQDLVDLFTLRAEQKGINLHYVRINQTSALSNQVDEEHRLPAIIEGDARRLRQILLNLLSNAVKFTEQGHVTLRVIYQHSRIRFEIEDTGAGIPETELERIFEPFQQVDLPSLRGLEGTGLGLSISRRLTRLMGGELRVQSVLGHGSIFWFESDFKVCSYQPIIDESNQSQITGFHESPLDVLVVDDFKDNLTLLDNLLLPLGFQVYQASDELGAWQQLKSYQPSLILIELDMSHLDSVQWIKAVRQYPHFAQITIIGLSNHLHLQQHDHALAIGCNGFLMKPLNTDHLLALIGETCQLTWIFAETEVTTSDLAQRLLMQQAALPEPEQLLELLELAEAGRLQGIFRQVDGLMKNSPHCRPFAEEVLHLARNFKLKKLRRLLKRLSQALD